MENNNCGWFQSIKDIRMAFLREKHTNIFQAVSTVALDFLKSLCAVFFYHSINISLLVN